MHSSVLTPTPHALPRWVPSDVAAYMAHTRDGHSIRSLARTAGCHASTILRRIRRTETRRDDVLVDDALVRLGRGLAPDEENRTMQTAALDDTIIDDAALRREAPRVLRRLNEVGACMALARDMEKAVIVRDGVDGQTIRLAVVDRPLAEALAVKDWISADGAGRIMRYRITQAGRAALKRMLADLEGEATSGAGTFSDQHRTYETREINDGDRRRKVRFTITESPLVTLSRRKDKEGRPFLSPDLVAAGERLREDFELAHLGPRVTQNWERFLTAGGRGEFGSGSGGGGSDAARRRVADALAALGPGLGDVILRCCCFLEGMEQVEKHMGWSARSGKIVLRIALSQLQRYYEETTGPGQPMIG